MEDLASMMVAVVVDPLPELLLLLGPWLSAPEAGSVPIDSFPKCPLEQSQAMRLLTCKNEQLSGLVKTGLYFMKRGDITEIGRFQKRSEGNLLVISPWDKDLQVWSCWSDHPPVIHISPPCWSVLQLTTTLTHLLVTLLCPFIAPLLITIRDYITKTNVVYCRLQMSGEHLQSAEQVAICHLPFYPLHFIQ